METEIELEQDQQRLRPAKSEVERLWADNSKAKRLLNWEAEYAGIEGLKRGLKDTATWFSVPENLQRYKVGVYNI